MEAKGGLGGKGSLGGKVDREKDQYKKSNGNNSIGNSENNNINNNNNLSNNNNISHESQLEFQSVVNNNVFYNIPWFYYPVSIQLQLHAKDQGQGKGQKYVRNMVNEPGYAERMVSRSNTHFVDNTSQCPAAMRRKMIQKQKAGYKTNFVEAGNGTSTGSRSGAESKSNPTIPNPNPNPIPIPKPPSAYLRFYKHSSPLNIDQIDHIDDRGGYFLALCRVYMSKIKIIPHKSGSSSSGGSELGDGEISELERLGC